MLTIIPDVLGDAQLQTVQSLLKTGQFTDGRLTAGSLAEKVKNSEELSNVDTIERLNSVVMATFVQNAVFQAVCHPVRVASPFYVRYKQGMSYGNHVDDPVMGPPGGQYRSDISATIFLNSPDDYDGGELIINTDFTTQKIKLNAGDAVIYPSSSLHRVAEIASGTRFVAVSWIQSMIRQPAQRDMLYQLYQSRENILKTTPGSADAEKLDHVYVNLMRMWAEV